MESLSLALSWLVVGFALASVLVLAARPRKTLAELLFALFCGSMAFSLLRHGFDGAPDWLALSLAMAGCATCNVYWLVARALFRGEAGVRLPQVATALAIGALVVAFHGLRAAGAPQAGLVALEALLTLASSAVLVLTIVEPMRGLHAVDSGERRLRLGFMLVYGGCVLAGTLSGALAQAWPEWQGLYRNVVLLCALSILVCTHIALELRRRQGRLADDGAATPAGAPRVEPSSQESKLAAAVRDAMEIDALYRETELKVSDLARHVGAPEHRISRVITRVLGARNFNQWVNRYRIEDACGRLREHPQRSVLEISLDVGFASLGPFNRAFKAAKGCTPSEWRSRPQAGPVGASGQAAGRLQAADVGCREPGRRAGVAALVRGHRSASPLPVQPVGSAEP